jgi:hypothetical protein
MDTLSTIKQMSANQPAFTESSLRWIIYRAADPSSKQAKFAPAIHRVGGRVLIDPDNFMAIAKSEG